MNEITDKMGVSRTVSPCYQSNFRVLIFWCVFQDRLNRQIRQAESYQTESNKTLDVISDELSNIGNIIIKTANDGISRDESNNTHINNLIEIISNVNKGLADSERHIMEQVLMIPGLVKGLKDQLTLEQLTEHLTSHKTDIDKLLSSKLSKSKIGKSDD